MKAFFHHLYQHKTAKHQQLLVCYAPLEEGPTNTILQPVTLYSLLYNTY